MIKNKGNGGLFVQGDMEEDHLICLLLTGLQSAVACGLVHENVLVYLHQSPYQMLIMALFQACKSGNENSCPSIPWRPVAKCTCQATG